jgi:hypothetical protein
MLKSILLAALCATLPMHMSDADAAAAPKALYFNEHTNLIFVDSADRAAEDGVRQIQPDEVDGLRAGGAAIDQTVTEFLGNGASAPSAATATPDASASTSATGADAGNADAAAASSLSATAATGASSEQPVSTESADASGEGAVSPAASTSASDTSSSAQAASPADDTAEHEAALAAQPNPGVTFEPVATASGPTTGELTAAASAPTLAEVPVDDAGTPIDQNTGKVVVDADAHSEAKDRFAGILAALHQFEEDSLEKLKNELRAIGTLLHLHSVASSQADATGDYKPSDLS